jgi:hypothetical protein
MNVFSLPRRTSLCQKLPSDFEVKLLVFQKHVIGLWKANNYLPRQNDNADETSVFLYVIQIYCNISQVLYSRWNFNALTVQYTTVDYSSQLLSRVLTQV